jgi:NADH:ubiquinone reductase (H+-translocating)
MIHQELTVLKRPMVVIVGGGFGGLHAARSVSKLPVEVVVIDKANHHLFQPLLYQVATAGLSPADIASPIRSILRKYRNLEVLMAEVVDVDLQQQAVILEDRSALPYDFLILATGSRHSYFGHPEWEALAPGLKISATPLASEQTSCLPLNKLKGLCRSTRRSFLLSRL